MSRAHFDIICNNLEFHAKRLARRYYFGFFALYRFLIFYLMHSLCGTKYMPARILTYFLFKCQHSRQTKGPNPFKSSFKYYKSNYKHPDQPVVNPNQAMLQFSLIHTSHDWVYSDTICNNQGFQPKTLVRRYYLDSFSLYNYLRSL